LPLNEVITAVTARLESVASVKNVYSYIREAKDGKKFIDLFKDPAAGVIHTWMITRAATKKMDDGTGCTRHIHDIKMLGYYALNDREASESTFQQIIEDACAPFDSLQDRQYGGQFDWSQPVQVNGPTVLMYANVLVHAVELLHKVEEVIYT
jgi:hypothetical protein